MKAKLIRPLFPAVALATALLSASLSAKDPAPVEPHPAVIPQRAFSVLQFGGKGDGKTLNTDAFRAAIQACAKAGGGRVVVPAGTFRTGPIELASHVALVVEKGAIIQASDRFSDFGLPDPLPATQQEIDGYKKLLRPLISGTKLDDIAIVGEGIIDGAGAGWWAKSDKAAERAATAPKAGDSASPKPTESPSPKTDKPAAPEKPLYVPRPFLIILRDCARVHLQGVTLRNSPMFHFVPHHCHDVVIEDVTIFSPADAPNTDGIDPANSRDVLIRRCTIDTGDDNIAVKGGGVANEPTENVTVTDCKFLHGHGVSIGSETEAGVRNLLVQRCAFENTGTALRIKSDRTRGGVVENVLYRDITMKNVEAAITVFLFYDDKKAATHPELAPITRQTPMVRNITFQKIVCHGTTRKAGELVGLPESPISDVVFDDVHIDSAAAPFTQQDVHNLRTANFDVQTAPATNAASSTR